MLLKGMNCPNCGFEIYDKLPGDVMKCQKCKHIIDYEYLRYLTNKVGGRNRKIK